jgi:hypothetical protein
MRLSTPKMVCRYDLLRSTEPADRGPDPLAVVVAKSERYPVSLRRTCGARGVRQGRAGKACPGSPRPGEVFEADPGERTKRSADKVLTHPAMAETDASRKRSRLVADRATLAAARKWWELLGGHNGTARRSIRKTAACGLTNAPAG